MQPKLSGLVSGEELASLHVRKSKAFDETMVTAASAHGLALKVAAEEAEGWTVSRRLKTRVRLEKVKPVDRQLEDDVWSLLFRMGFKEMNADRRFMVGEGTGRQLDVFAKDDETVFIVECTHSREGGPKSVKSLVDKICAIREDVVKAVHGHYGKDPKLKVKFAIATRNVEWRKADRERCHASGIAIVTDDDLRYFSKLVDLLRAAARYQFLGRYFRGEKVEGLRNVVPATRGRAAGKPFYNFLISPHELLRLAYISHRSKTSNDDLDTYQRMVKPQRLNQIGRFIDEGGRFPTNIVINVKSNGGMNFDQKESFGDTATGSLHLPTQYGCAWIIDGQHRLYGFAHASRSAEDDRSVVPVLAYENLSVRDEIALFVDINTKQVKVSRNLVNEIVSTLNIDDENPAKRLEALYARIALKLGDHPRSPIKDRVLTVSQDRTRFRCLTLTSLSDGIAENSLLGTLTRTGKGSTVVLSPGPLSDIDGDPKGSLEKAVETLSGYFGLFASRLDGHWALGDDKGGYLCTNNGLRALLMLFRKLVAFVERLRCIKATTLDPDDTVDALAPYVAPVIGFFANADEGDVAAFRSRGSSIQSVGNCCLQMMSIIHESMPEFTTPEIVNYMSNRDVEGTKAAKEMIHEINRILFEDVVATLKQAFGAERDAWWDRGVPKAVRNRCDLLYNENPGERERWRHLVLSNYPDIILSSANWDLFKDRYAFQGKGRRADQISWIGRINKARAVTDHAEKGPLNRDEVEYVRLVHRLVKHHIEDGEPLVPGRRYIHEGAGVDGIAEAAE